MKKVFKKSLAFILALTMVFGAAPLAGLVGLELPSLKDVFADKAEAATLTYSQLKAKFPDGKYWNHGSGGNNPNGYTSSPCSHAHGNCSYSGSCGCNSFNGIAIQCYGFALKLGYDYYGSNPKTDWGRAYNLDNLKPGDIVNYNGNGHTVFVIGVNGNDVTVAECNRDGHCRIDWGRHINKSGFNNLLNVYVAPYAMNTGNSQITLNFNANSGTGSMSSQTVNYGDKVTLPANTFSKTGYTFNGWTVKRNNDNKWYTTSAGWCTEDTIKSNGYSKAVYWNSRTLTFDSSWTSGVSGTVKVTFYAQWVPNTLKVYYNANGASITSDTYIISSNIIYTKSDSTKFYQKWTYNNTKENGLINRASFGLYKTGYHFAGWGTSASGGTIYDENNASIVPTTLNANIKKGDCSVTLYAQWVPNTLIVYYNSNGASITSDKFKTSSNIICYKSDSTKYYQQWTYNNTKENGLINCASFGLYKTGYHFAGWGTSANGGTVYDENDSTLTPIKLSSSIKDKSQSLTLYAQWVPNTVSVYYCANGGTVSSETYKVSADYIYTKSDSVKLCQKWTYNNPQKNGLVNASTLGLQRNGYTFAGWSTSASGGTVFDQNNVNIVPTDFASAINNKNCSVTMYAQWTPNKVTMHFQSAGELLCQTHTATNNGKLVTKNAIERTSATQLKCNGNTYSVTGNKTATLTYGVDSDRVSIKDAGLSLAEHEGCGYIAYRDYDGKWRAYINGVVGWYTTEEISNAVSNGTFGGYNIYAQSGALKTTSPKGNIYFYAVWVCNHTHNYVLTDSHEGSCTEASYSTYTCSCGDSYKIVSGGTGHSWLIGSYLATCEKGGCSTRTCMRCGIGETTESEPLGHDYKGNVVKEPTCTEEGEIEYKCIRCEKKYTESIPQVAHNYVETVIEPTCTSNGYTITKCSECGEETVGNYVDPKSHDMHPQTVSPTCTEEGYTVWECSECGETIIDNYVDPKPHNMKSETVLPTCTEKGYTVRTCSDCGYCEIVDYTTEKGHHYNSDWTVVKNATYNEDGQKQRNCVSCGYTEFEIIPKLAFRETCPECSVMFTDIDEYYAHIQYENLKKAYAIYIVKPSSATIDFGDAIILHADVANELTVGMSIKWTASNGNFDMSVSADGLTCKVSPKSNGKTVFTATVYDKDGNVISSDTQEMTAKAGLWQKIVAFFKKIFGLTKTFPEAFKGIF